MRARRPVVLPAVAAACLLIAGIGGYGALAVLDREAFADRDVRSGIRRGAPGGRRPNRPPARERPPIVLALVALALLAFAVWRERDHRRAAWGAGLAVAAAGGLTAVGVTAAHDFVLVNFDTGFGDAVVSSVWDAYLADLRLLALTVGAGGLVVVAAAGGPRPPLLVGLAAPSSRRGRGLRAAGLLGVAALAVELPELLLHTGFVALAAGWRPPSWA